MNSALVEGLCRCPVIYRDVRVITLAQMDEVHERPEGTAGRTFRAHRDKLIEEEDYYCVPLREVTTLNVDASKYASCDLIVLSESGYLMLVKAFRDDLAWEVQRALVSSYFRAKHPVAEDPLLGSLKAHPPRGRNGSSEEAANGEEIRDQGCGAGRRPAPRPRPRLRVGQHDRSSAGGGRPPDGGHSLDGPPTGLPFFEESV